MALPLGQISPRFNMIDEKDKRMYEKYANHSFNPLAKRLLKNFLAGPLINYFFDLRIYNNPRVSSNSRTIFVANHSTNIEFPLVLAIYELGKNPHAQIHEKTFKNLPRLFSLIEQVPFNPEVRLEEVKENNQWSIGLLEKYLEKEESVLIMTDGPKYLKKTNGKTEIRSIDERPFSQIPIDLARKTNAPIIPISTRVPEIHSLPLSTLSGKEEVAYMKRNRKVPYGVYFSEPVYAEDQTSCELKIKIRRKQLEGIEFLKSQNI